MKNFIILIVQLCGFAFIFVSVLSVLNYMFDLGLGYKGTEVPGEPEFAAVFLVLGLILTPLGWYLNKKVSV
ncbi:MAG: hypothetical protein R2747_18180 [Pyrinomonadaceae bacterium]